MNAGAWGQVFNIGSTQEVSILDLAQKVIDLSKSDSTVRLISYDEAYAKGFEDMLRRKPCVDKLSAAIGFRPMTSLDTIVSRML